MGQPRRKGLIALGLILAVVVIITGVEIASGWMNRGYVKAEGYLEEGLKKEIYVDSSTRVKEVLVKVGDRVKDGQLLAVLESDDYSLELEEALLNLEQAKLELQKYKLGLKQKERALEDAREAVEQAERDLERITLLYKEGVVSKDQLETYQSKLDAAMASLRDSEDALELYNVSLASLENRVKLARIGVKEIEEKIRKHSPNIKSPMNGIVTKVSIKEGTFTDPSHPVIVVSDLSTLIVKVNIGAEDISKIELGQKVEVTADIIEGEYFEGKVDSISPLARISPSGQTGKTVVEVTVRLLGTSPLLLPGMPVEVKIIPDEWSHQAEITRTSILPDKDILYVDGKQGGEIWTAYTDRIGGSPPAVFLSVNQLSTGRNIGTLKVSRGDGARQSPGIMSLGPEDKVIFWQSDRKGKKYIEYVRIESNLVCPPPREVIQGEYDLLHPVKVEGQDGGHYIAAVWKRGSCFGFNVYQMKDSGLHLVLHTDTVLKDESVALGFRDFTASIEGIKVCKCPGGYIFIWAERQDNYGTLCFLKTGEQGNVLIPRKEIVRYYILSQRGDFDVEFSQESIFVFWTEMNNPIDKYFQISMLQLDYTGQKVKDRHVVAPGVPGFRGAVDVTRDASGNIHAVWIDQDPRSKRINRDIFYQLMDDKGNALVPSRKMVAKMDTQKYPELHVLDNGIKILVWMDLEGDGYSLVYKSTHPELVENLKKANWLKDIRQRFIKHMFNLATSLGTAVLLFIPYNILPLMLFCLFLYLVVFERIEQPLYYLLFLLLVFPVKYYNGLLFKSIFSGMMDIRSELLLAINCVTALFPITGMLFYLLRDKPKSLLDSFCYIFASWLYLDTVCAVAVAFYSMF